MTSDEADDIIQRMKSGMKFSDYDSEYSWFYSYSDKDQKFHYMDIWTVGGSIVDEAEYSDAEFKNMLTEKQSYRDIMASLRPNTP